MGGIDWPLWIIAFSVLLAAISFCLLLASLVLVLRKIGAAADAIGSAVSQAGLMIRKRFSGDESIPGVDTGKRGSAGRGLAAVIAVFSALAKIAGRKKSRH